MYKFYISVAIAIKIFILPANQIMLPDQHVVVYCCLEFLRTTFSGFGVISEGN